MKHNEKHGKKSKKKRIMSQKKGFGCAKATNFELEIEDRGHLADMSGLNRKRGGIKRTGLVCADDEL